MTQRCFIGLGSNLDDPLARVKRAVAALAELPDTRLIRHSPWYGSRAVGPGEQPDYVNGAAEIATDLSPHELLAELQRIEHRQGRERRERWAARTLDLDILLYGDLTLATDTLTIPHPRLQERPFVVYPLYDIAPSLRLPDGTSLSALLDYLPSDSLWRLAPSEP